MHCNDVLVWSGLLIDSFSPIRNINILAIFYILNFDILSTILLRYSTRLLFYSKNDISSFRKFELYGKFLKKVFF